MDASNVPTANSTTTGYWLNDVWIPSDAIWNQPFYVVPQCLGNTHTWACDHAERCQCGQARRIVTPCARCGQ